MSSTSQKHRNFVQEPMAEKPVTDLAGIGETLGGRLGEQGFDKIYIPTSNRASRDQGSIRWKTAFDKAYVVLGQFLVLKKDEEMFGEWLKEACGANRKQQGDCYNCLKEWTDNFL